MKKNIILLSTILFVFSLTSIEKAFSEPTDANLEHQSTIKTLHGAWEVFKDDDIPGQSSPKEILFFSDDGRLIIEGPKRFIGVYKVEDDKINMICNHKGREAIIKRKFTIINNTLQLANPQSGFAHYKKIDEPFPKWSLDESWEYKKFGYVSLKVPANWEVHTEPPNEQGHQRFQIANSDGTKMLMVMRAPLLKDIPSEEIAPFVKLLIEEFIKKSPMSGTTLEQANSKNLYGIPGPNFIAKAGQSNPFVCQSVGLKLEKAFVVLLTFYLHDELQELNTIIQTLEVDGAQLVSKEAS